MSAKVLTKAAAKEAKLDIIEDGRGTQAVHDVVVAIRAARRSGTANTKTKAEVICRSSPETNRRGEGLGRIRFVRREDVQIGAQRKIGATCHRRRREHGAVARVRENFGHARGARETRGAIEFALSYWFAS